MKRVTPLVARKRINPKRSKPRRRPFLPNPAYLAFVRGLPCSAPQGPGGCHGRIEAHHMGERGLGQKAPDESAVALCTFHHRCWHDARGIFVDWTKERRAVWATALITDTRLRWFMHAEAAPTRGSA